MDLKISMELPSYPTGSLDFLETLRKDDRSITQHAKVKLNVLISGAGLGGLATAIALARTGHTVTVFEQAPALGEVGAGIQIPSNSSRLLLKWGISEKFKQRAVAPSSMYFRRWQNGQIIGNTRLIPDFEDNFDAPYYVAHRAHLHEALYELALSHGVEVKVDHTVASVDGKEGSVTLADGTVCFGDLIIGADGIKSLARAEVLGGEPNPPSATGFAAYRAIVDAEDMRRDTDTAWLLEHPNLNLWIGHQRHVMTYSISAGKSFNMVLSHPDTSNPETWNQENALRDMREHFKDWDPRLRKLISMIKATLKWPLMSGSKLPTWIHPSNKLIITGDAAHSMLPYMSQGAAMAVEDGAALAQALRLISSVHEIPKALHTWQAVRLQRSSQMQEASLLNGKLWHFPDGLEQEARDAGMRPEVEGRHFIRSPNQWSDPTTQRWCYGYDAEEEIRIAWKRSQTEHKEMDGGEQVNGVPAFN